jgi:hypothetical protein
MEQNAQCFEWRAKQKSLQMMQLSQKKEAVQTGLKLAQNVLENGKHNRGTSNLSRLKWVIDSAETTLRSS